MLLIIAGSVIVIAIVFCFSMGLGMMIHFSDQSSRIARLESVLYGVSTVNQALMEECNNYLKELFTNRPGCAQEVRLWIDTIKNKLTLVGLDSKESVKGMYICISIETGDVVVKDLEE